MSRSIRVVAALVALQAVLVGSYWLIEHRREHQREHLRSPDGAMRSELGTAPPVGVTGTLPPLSLRRRDSRRFELGAPERPTLVHVWATWCRPCRTELPGLLAVPEEHPIDVVAIALDEDWADVERFLGRARHSNVFLGDSREIQRTLSVHSLPVTFLVQPGGQLRWRFEGARDWTDSGYLQTWIDVIGNE